LANINEIKCLRGGDLQVAAQANVQIDAEIGQKDHFWMGIPCVTHGDRPPLDMPTAQAAAQIQTPKTWRHPWT